MPLIKSISGIRGTIGDKVGEDLTPKDIVLYTSSFAMWIKRNLNKEKYKIVEGLVKQIQEIKNKNIKIDNQLIKEIVTVNGVRFVLEDGSWGLIRASSNKPSLVVVTESTSSDSGKKKIFNFIIKEGSTLLFKLK